MVFISQIWILFKDFARDIHLVAILQCNNEVQSTVSLSLSFKSSSTKGKYIISLSCSVQLEFQRNMHIKIHIDLIDKSSGMFIEITMLLLQV